MSAATRPPYDLWRDIDGTHILVGARVEQVAIRPGLGAPRCRHCQVGTVVRFGYKRLVVLFAGNEVTIHPSTVRVVPLTAERVIADLRSLLHTSDAFA